MPSAEASRAATGFLATRVPDYQQRIEGVLARALEIDGGATPRLLEAMRYSTLGGGKRVRPLLVYAAAEVAGASADRADPRAAAVELIHAYSLVHDDLPCMDDDSLRRGKPTCHVAFDEATALLAGDALQSLAFERLAAAPLPADARVAMLRELAVAAGASGMCGGQALDIGATGTRMPLAALERMHALKTGALLRAAVRLGVPAVIARAGADAVDVIAFRRHGPCSHAALDVAEARATTASDAGAGAIVAAEIAAAEARLHQAGGDRAVARARHVRVPLAPGVELRAADIPWAPECFACGGRGVEMSFA